MWLEPGRLRQDGVPRGGQGGIARKNCWEIARRNVLLSMRNLNGIRVVSRAVRDQEDPVKSLCSNEGKRRREDRTSVQACRRGCGNEFRAWGVFERNFFHFWKLG